MNKDNPTEQYRTMLENLAQQPENLQQLEAIAENGNAEVMHILGWCYFKGEYLERNLDKSMYWLKKAKNAGYKQAEKLLVYCQLIHIFAYILLVFFMLFVFVFAGIPMLSSMQVAKLAKNPKNIRDNGCLLYADKTDKHGGSMFYLNQKGPYTLRQLAIKPDDLSRKMGKLIDDSGLSYYEFVGVHSKECIKVRYIHNKILWASGDKIYDLQ